MPRPPRKEETPLKLDPRSGLTNESPCAESCREVMAGTMKGRNIIVFITRLVSDF